MWKNTQIPLSGADIIMPQYTLMLTGVTLPGEWWGWWLPLLYQSDCENWLGETFGENSLLNDWLQRLQIKIILALVSLLIFTRKEHKLKFSCRKFIIFQVQRIFCQLRNYCFARGEFWSINLVTVVIIQESFQDCNLLFPCLTFCSRSRYLSREFSKA